MDKLRATVILFVRPDIWTQYPCTAKWLAVDNYLISSALPFFSIQREWRPRRQRGQGGEHRSLLVRRLRSVLRHFAVVNRLLGDV
jgi:hypothetical protein